MPSSHLPLSDHLMEAHHDSLKQIKRSLLTAEKIYSLSLMVEGPVFPPLRVSCVRFCILSFLPLLLSSCPFSSSFLLLLPLAFSFSLWLLFFSLLSSSFGVTFPGLRSFLLDYYFFPFIVFLSVLLSLVFFFVL